MVMQKCAIDWMCLRLSPPKGNPVSLHVFFTERVANNTGVLGVPVLRFFSAPSMSKRERWDSSRHKRRKMLLLSSSDEPGLLL